MKGGTEERTEITFVDNATLKCHWMGRIVSADIIYTNVGYCCTLAWQRMLKVNVTLLLNVTFLLTEGIKNA